MNEMRVKELERKLADVKDERDEYAKALDEFSAILNGKKIEHHIEVTAALCDGKMHNGLVFALAELRDDVAEERRRRVKAEENINKLDKERLWILGIASTRLTWSRRWKRLARRYAGRLRRQMLKLERES